MALAGVLVQPGAIQSVSGSSDAPSSPSAALGWSSPPHAVHPKHSQRLQHHGAGRTPCSMAPAQQARTAFDVAGVAEALRKDPRKILRALEGLAAVASDSESVIVAVQPASHASEISLSAVEGTGALLGAQARHRLATEIADAVASRVLQQIAKQSSAPPGQQQLCVSVLEADKSIAPHGYEVRVPGIGGDASCGNSMADGIACQQGPAQEPPAPGGSPASIYAEPPEHADASAIDPCASNNAAHPAGASLQPSSIARMLSSPTPPVANTETGNPELREGHVHEARTGSTEAKTPPTAAALLGQRSQDELDAILRESAAGRNSVNVQDAGSYYG